MTGEVKPRVPRYRYGQHGFLASVRQNVLERAKQSGEEVVSVRIEDLERLLDIADRADAPGTKGRPPKHSVRFRRMVIEETRQRLNELTAAYRRAPKPTSDHDKDIAEIIKDAANELGCTEKQVWEMHDHPGRIGKTRPRKSPKKAASAE
ncbi:hypothetical protein I6F29_35630 [Bradyrhizobium sp. NBAIM16]|uniref:hypothetical protein n=1 Tax=Bradyrhizobium sp. NBAIM16 TaxID=2793813 RepID=UPI001CD57880|nr:hypothetical protein [Bradyrhizobium sp. NBAIM16]MCA1431181.1 hypothetical protein [Bradyrhizobium sp. NBAIM16]